MLVKEWGGVWASVGPIVHHGLTVVLTMAQKPYIKVLKSVLKPYENTASFYLSKC